MVVAGHSEYLLAPNLAAQLRGPRFWTDTEISQKVQDVVRFDEAVQSFEDCAIHLLDRVKRTITIPDDVLVPEMKIGGEPDVGHRDSSLSRRANERVCYGRSSNGQDYLYGIARPRWVAYKKLFGRSPLSAVVLVSPRTWSGLLSLLMPIESAKTIALSKKIFRQPLKLFLSGFDSPSYLLIMHNSWAKMVA